MLREKILIKRVLWETITLLVVLPTSFLSLLWYEHRNQLPIQAAPGYQVSLFASGDADYRSPDGVDVDQVQGHVFLDYPNITAKDGSDHKTSTVVEYDMTGKVLKKFSVSGH